LISHFSNYILRNLELLLLIYNINIYNNIYPEGFFPSNAEKSPEKANFLTISNKYLKYLKKNRPEIFCFPRPFASGLGTGIGGLKLGVVSLQIAELWMLAVKARHPLLSKSIQSIKRQKKESC